MAELLIFNKEHWMDKLTGKDIVEYVKKYPNFQKKYDARYQKGDIVEVREDGYFTKVHHFDKNSFAVVKVGDKALKDVEYLNKPDEKVLNAGTEQEIREVLKRRKYQVDMNAVSLSAGHATFEKLEDITIIDKGKIV